MPARPLGLLGTLNPSGNNGLIDIAKALEDAREATGMDLRGSFPIRLARRP